MSKHLSLLDATQPPHRVTHRVTAIAGDGIGPEVMAAARRVLDAAGVSIAWEDAEAGGAAFARGVVSGVPSETIASIARTRVLFKGPLETPVGHGGKSANVTLRKLFETFANVRPVREIPGVPTRFSGSGVDLVVVRENVEDLYAGIEHMQTPEVAQCLKLISRKGCEKIVRLAFELARAEGRTRVHCATKANIMKLTEGLMKKVFEEIATDYPEIEAKHIIIDNCAHQLVMKPQQFQVIVTTNLNGDILSDLCSGLIGGLGFSPSVNLGHDVAIFEPVHGSAPDIAGQDKANPTAMILSGAILLRHLGEMEAAIRVENAVLATLEEGAARTPDMAAGGPSVGTRAYTEAVIAHLGCAPKDHAARAAAPLRIPARMAGASMRPAPARAAIGVDVFIESESEPEAIGSALAALAVGHGFELKMISNRGTQVYPARDAETDCVNHWRCRFLATSRAADIPARTLARLLEAIEVAGWRWMHIEKLQEFDGVPAYTRAQGED